MPAKKLTAVFVENVRPAAARVEYRDDRNPGFGLRVCTSGAKSWMMLYRLNGKVVRETLGKYPTLGLADARALAAERERAVQAGIDPPQAQGHEDGHCGGPRQRLRVAALPTEQHDEAGAGIAATDARRFALRHPASRPRQQAGRDPDAARGDGEARRQVRRRGAGGVECGAGTRHPLQPLDAPVAGHGATPNRG